MKKKNNDFDQNQKKRKSLIDLLHLAAQLEHCLLDAYLYTACSLKTIPEEFASAGFLNENNRRAIQFERTRDWKQSILEIAVEEMFHLHYVQCMLRALGAPPSLSSLPKRDKNKGMWVIPNWKAVIGKEPVNEGKGVEVHLSPLTEECIRRFVLYESTDALQDNNPFGDKIMSLFEKLHEFELDLRFERMLYNVDNDVERQEIKKDLKKLYVELVPTENKISRFKVSEDKVVSDLLHEVRFQSIAVFYKEGILPLYEEAFDFGWVTHSNRSLDNELIDIPAEEGFLDMLSVGPVYRSFNFQNSFVRNIQDPLRYFKNIRSIIEEIVEEGEGMSNFESNANALLEKLDKPNGSRQYLEALLKDKHHPRPHDYETPEWLSQSQNLRMSHLYRFAMIMVEIRQEVKLSKKCGVIFQPSRMPHKLPDSDVALKKIAEEIPYQFNSCYLVLQTWLSRIYEIPEWEEDKSHRKAIEMLATWPLMSLTIRPFLELASFFPVKTQNLFRIEHDWLPILPIHAKDLLDVYANPQRSEKINRDMDYLVMHVLSDVATWADNKLDVVKNSDIDLSSKEMILTRLKALANLKEFQNQFEFRVHGGYSNQLPDLTYQQLHGKDSQKFMEDPTALTNDEESPPIYQKTFALRIRFSGWGLVQMATDPDPPTDEAGCTGTLMTHASDNAHFNYTISWQHDNSGGMIKREPRKELPELGVNCVDLSLVVADDEVQTGYTPLQIMSSTGAVQASGVQMDLDVTGFSDVLTLTPEDIVENNKKIRITLLEKDGTKPQLVGLNHLVSHDGEPIDPFIIAVTVDSLSPQAESLILFQREIYNENNSLLQMSPLQRALSVRFPIGFDSFGNIPEWVKKNLASEICDQLNNPKFPESYLVKRAQVLSNALSNDLKSYGTQKEVDQTISFAERLLDLTARRTTTDWLGALLHYGHTVSGNSQYQNINPIFERIAKDVNLRIGFVDDKDRYSSNTRWLVRYTLGVMDTDALSNLVFGELYIPVTANFIENKPVNLKKTWKFDTIMKSLIVEYAQKFNNNPLWPFISESDKQRITKLPNSVNIVEEIQSHDDVGYSCKITGFKGINNYNGSFVVSESKNQSINLEWKVWFNCNDSTDLPYIVGKINRDAQQITQDLTERFGPNTRTTS